MTVRCGEWPGGISPPGSHRTGRDGLPSSGSHRSASGETHKPLMDEEAGLALVGRWHLPEPQKCPLTWWALGHTIRTGSPPLSALHSVSSEPRFRQFRPSNLVKSRQSGSAWRMRPAGLSSTNGDSARASTIAGACSSTMESRPRLVMFPVATTRRWRGERFRRWLSRKSRSFVTTTRSSPSASLASASSVVRFPSGRSEVWTASCPAAWRS